MRKNYPSYSLIQTLKRPLLLQGPIGGFFNHLMREFIANDALPFKINFNGGDETFMDKSIPNMFSYNLGLDSFSKYLSSFIKDHQIDGIILFGDCRPLHKLAIQYCKKNNVPVFIFEEGYIRPNFITFELGGVNANSILASSVAEHFNDPEFYLNYKSSQTFEESKHLQQKHYHNMKDLTKNAMIYWAGMFMKKDKYAQYVHHKDNNIVKSSLYWVKSYFKNISYKRTEKHVEHDVAHNPELHKKYFLVCLQVYNDSQIRDHSPYKNNKKFIYDTLKSFSLHGKKDDKIIIKQHPLDMPYHDYSKYINHLEKHLKLEGRVIFVHNLNLPLLLKNSKGLVTINSTTGLSALYHETPVQVLGKAIYDMDGLCHQNGLDKFWTSDFKVNYELFKKFREFIIDQTQIVGSFYNQNHYPKILETSKKIVTLQAKDECYWFGKLKEEIKEAAIIKSYN